MDGADTRWWAVVTEHRRLVVGRLADGDGESAVALDGLLGEDARVIPRCNRLVVAELGGDPRLADLVVTDQRRVELVVR